MASIEFTAFARATEGRAASRRMRRLGKTPGIVYGGTDTPAPIELDHNALIHALRNEAFHSSILTMKLNGSTTKVLLRDLQMPGVLRFIFQPARNMLDETLLCQRLAEKGFQFRPQCPAMDQRRLLRDARHPSPTSTSSYRRYAAG